MIRLIVVQLFLVTFLLGEDLDIKKLQNEFIENVIELNVYKKRYSQFLNKKCQKDYICLQEQIQRLKTWESVQNDKILKKLLKKKLLKTLYDKEYWEKVLTKITQTNINLKQSQFISIIDLENQYFIVALWDNETKQYNYIGRDLISSGNIKREAEVKLGENHYLKTPAGVFETKQGWRSDGKKKDDNFTLGYGEKDRYIFYFGKHETLRYNTFDKEGNKIQNPDKWRLIRDKLDFALHSHRSSMPMGTANSHGCVRTTDELNRFLDNNLVLHKNLLNGTQWRHKYAKAPELPAYYNLAGKYLIVLDNI
jgi:hypothetical protein